MYKFNVCSIQTVQKYQYFNYNDAQTSFLFQLNFTNSKLENNIKNWNLYMWEK